VIVATIHSKAMPVILTTATDVDLWLTADAPMALELPRRCPTMRSGSSPGEKEDKPFEAARGRCQSKRRLIYKSTCSATPVLREAIYAARARHSAKTAEGLCL
jgi:hypothetical protein